MKRKIAVILLLALTVATVACVAVACSPSELSMSNLEGWTLRFTSNYFLTSDPSLVFTDSQCNTVEYALEDYLPDEKYMHLSFVVAGYPAQFQAEVYYKGRLQDDYVVTYPLLFGYSSDGTEWTTTRTVKESGEYRMDACHIAKEEDVKVTSGSVSVVGLSFNLAIVIA